MTGSPAPRVLVYRAIGLGDFLTGVPAYRAVARAFPTHEVCLAAPEPLRPLAELTGALDTFLPTVELAAPPWQGTPPDVVVNLHGRGPQSHRLLADLRPGRLVAFGSADAGVEGPEWRADEHEVRRWCRLLEDCGIPAAPDQLGLVTPRTPAAVPAATVLHPGAASPARRWPADRFAAVARALEAEGHHVVVTGVAAEAPLAGAVSEAAGLRPDRVLAGRQDLEELAALVAAARLVVCGDTGVGHLATAYGTPSVLLFGPTPPALWGPPADRGHLHRVLWHGEIALRTARHASRDTVHPALLALQVDEVLAAVGVRPRP